MYVKKAAKYFGSKKRLAETIGVTPQAVTHWGALLPLARAAQVEFMTRGRLKVNFALYMELPKDHPRENPEDTEYVWNPGETEDP